MIMNSREAYDLMYKIGVSNLELEAIISEDGYYSVMYAKEIIKGKFKLGEEIISKDWFYSWFYSWCYAKNVLKSRFRLGEKVITKTGNFNYDYALDYTINVMGYKHE